MVRRWSYINSINSYNTTPFQTMQKATFDTTMNTTMYLRKVYAPATRLTRKQWARRKHIHNWLAHSNVLKDWARSYRFHKNHNKLAYYQFFTKTSFLAFNVIGARNSIPALHKGSENLVTGSFSRRVFKYFQLHSNPRFSFLRFFKNSRLLAVSYYALEDNYLSLKENTTIVPLFSDNLTSVTPYDHTSSSQASALACYVNLISTPLTLILTQISLVYRTLVILTLMRS